MTTDGGSIMTENEEKAVKDFRDKSGTGYVFFTDGDLFRWEWHEPPHESDASRGRWPTLAAALRDAADDWESNGSGARRAAVLRGAATRAEGVSS